MSWSGKRIIVAGLLTAALGLMLCPPWRAGYYHGHRLLWRGRGSLDWSRLALEFCLVAVIGAIVAAVAPMIGRPSVRALKVWFHRAGLVMACAAVLILGAIGGYDAIVRFALLHDYNKKVREFQAKEPLLQEAFPLNPGNHLVPPPPPGFDEDVYRISNFHEAELMLRSLSCDDRSVQRAMARFLSASTPGYDNKTLTFVIGTSGKKAGDCLAKDIFDKVTAEAGAAAKSSTPQAPPGFTVDEPATPSQLPPELRPAPRKGRPPIRTKAGQIDFREYEEPKAREIVFEFHIRDSDAAKLFFAPLPDWQIEALRRNIEVARVPDWMTPGEPPAPWSFTEWLDLRSPWLVLVAGMLVLSALSFVVARRIDRPRP